MVQKIDDPITGTEWVDTSDPTGTAMTILMGVIGIGMLFTVIGISRNTVVPLLNQAFAVLPGVSTGDGGGIDFE